MTNTATATINMPTSPHTTKTPRYFVGYADGDYTIIRERTDPTAASHGARFSFIIGPFSRKSGAIEAVNIQRRGWR